MEAVDVREVKLLHFCDVIQTFEVILGQSILSGGAAVFDSTDDVLHFYDILSNLFEVTF